MSADQHRETEPLDFHETDPFATRPTEPLPDLPGFFDSRVLGDASEKRPPTQDAGDIPPSDETLRPRIRWAGIVWGIVLAAVAAVAVWFTTGDGPVERLGQWAQDVEPVTLIAGGLLAIGALVLLTGIVGLARRAQTRADIR